MCILHLSDVKHYFWEDPFLFKICADQVIRRLSSPTKNRQNNQGAVYQAPPYQPPTNQPLVNQDVPLVSQIQGVSKTDLESYAKANDANMNNLQMKLDNFQEIKMIFKKFTNFKF
ncbi:hypothetical protein Tco_0456842, partial [Tanacetum coccineum]